MSEKQPQHEAAAPASRPDGCGRLLLEARERSGTSLEEAAGEVRMPVRVLRALEQEDWSSLGAPVFVRGQLRSYARFLKVDVTPYLEQRGLERVQPVELVSRSHTPRYQRVLESLGRRAVYVVLTAAIAVPVWVATQWDMDELSPQRTAALDLAVPADGSAVAGQNALNDGKSRSEAATVVASLTPLPRSGNSGLGLRATGDSWIEIDDSSGRTIEKGMLKAGQERSFRKGDVSRVVLGNAAAVEVHQAGRTVDLAPFQRANVARFAVSSDGSLVPIAD